MAHLARKLLFYASWVARCKLLGQRIPLTSSLIISDRCTLQCKHCTVTNLGYPHLGLGELRRDLDTLYAAGARVLIVTGGEPFLWRDGAADLEQVVRHARRRGFFRVVICTNGTLALESSADYLWVSLDGEPRVHDGIRGEVFQRVWRNIRHSSHPRIYVNYTASRLNHHNLEQAFERMLRCPQIRGVMFHLFTPVMGSDDLALEGRQRREVVGRLLRLKRRHPLAVTNTFDGLAALRDNNWQRPVWSASVINQGDVTPCCCRRGIYNEQTCRLCGCHLQLHRAHLGGLPRRTLSRGVTALNGARDVWQTWQHHPGPGVSRDAKNGLSSRITCDGRSTMGMWPQRWISTRVSRGMPSMRSSAGAVRRSPSPAMASTGAKSRGNRPHRSCRSSAGQRVSVTRAKSRTLGPPGASRAEESRNQRTRALCCSLAMKLDRSTARAW